MNPSNQNIPKSSIAAGLLGIFLGGFGAHDWYLGDKKKGIIHLAIFGGGFVVFLLASIMTAVASFANIGILTFFFGFLDIIAYIALAGNSIWGLVEGIIILVQGDAGLAAKGYAVAFQPTATTTEAKSEETKPEETKTEEKTDKKAKSDK